MTRFFTPRGGGFAIAAFLAAAWLAAPAQAQDGGPFYRAHVLVSDGAVPADFVDHNLKNPWGIAFNPFGFVWVANNHTGTSTLYDGTGKANSLIVTIPAVDGDETGNPTGIVFSGGEDFVVTSGGKSGPARFMFAAESGHIFAWAPNVDLTHAISVVDRSGRHAAYFGLAIGGNGRQHRIYAADFHNGRIDVFDDSFTPVNVEGAFVDPNLPEDYFPFGIQNVNGDIVVTYAQKEEDEDEEMAGPGLGIVDLYSARGRLISRVASHGQLNAPWGVALAPRSFGRLGGSLLVGNFGDGRINAYNLRTGDFLGTLRGRDGKPLSFEGLWGIAFGNGIMEQPPNTLFFAAGVNDEEGGAYGMITAEGR